MNESLGGTLFWIAVAGLVFTFISGWIILITVTILQYIFPNSSDKFDFFLKRNGEYFEVIQKYSLIIAVGLFVLRMLVGWLGWASQFP